MIEFHLTSAAAPEAVLSAIRDDLREWHESVIPRPLWNRGVLQVVGSVKAPHFRLHYWRRWQRSRGGDPLELRGTVKPTPDGGSVISGRCGLTRGRHWLVIVFAVFGAWAWIDGGWTGAWPAFAVAAAVALIEAFQTRGGASRDDPEARYLVERAEHAVARTAMTTQTTPHPDDILQ